MSSILKRKHATRALTILALVLAAVSAASAQSVEDFRQPKNSDPANVEWINSILNNTNSQYAEGMSVPQRYIVSGLSGGTHSLVLKHQAVKSSLHAYDFVTSWQQAYDTGAYFAGPPYSNMLSSMFTLQCGGNISATAGPICDALHAGGFFLDIDAPDAMGTINGDDVAARIAKYEAIFGNRTVRVYSNAAVTSGSMVFNGYNNDAGDTYALYTLTWQSTGSQAIVEMAGHLAASIDNNGIGYGTGKGSGSINGGPYHFKLGMQDGTQIGSSDNQIQGSNIIVPTPCRVEGPSPVCPGSFSTYTGPLGGFNYVWSVSGFTGTASASIVGANTNQTVNVSASGSGSYTLNLAITNQLTGDVNNCNKVIQVTTPSNPTLIGCPLSTSATCYSQVPAPPAVTAVDACGNPILVVFNQSETNPGKSCGNVITRTWTAADSSGKTVSCIQLITVSDTIAPVLSGVPSNVTVQCGNIPAAANPTATDNCDPSPKVTMQETSTKTSNGSCTDFSYSITRTWTATDACGNVSSKTQIITVSDTTAPVLSGVPGNITVECNVPAPPTVTAADNCDPNPKVTLSEMITPGSGTGQYTLTRTWTAKDACGNASSASQVITVDDNTPPSLVGVPGDITVECSAIPAPPNVTATDNCDPNPKVSFSEQKIAGNCPGNYTLKRTWTATDASGNSVSATQTITIHDTTKPILLNVPADVTVECDNVPPAATNVTATDNCDSSPRITFAETKTAGSCPGNYTLKRTWTAIDNCGNAISATQTVTVRDTTKPNLVGVPGNITVECDAIPSAPTVTATDNCDSGPTVKLTESRTSGSCVNKVKFTITRTWTATDSCGNSSSASQTITVRDTTAPVITCSGDIAVQSPDINPCATAVRFTVTAQDNCDANPIISCMATFPDGSVKAVKSGDVFPQGTTLITCSATDSCGNVSGSCTFNITVTCPPIKGIEIKKYQDVNGNGVQDPGDGPLAGVRFQVCYTPVGGVLRCIPGPGDPPIQTDANGEVYVNIPQGASYVISEIVPGSSSINTHWLQTYPNVTTPNTIVVNGNSSYIGVLSDDITVTFGNACVSFVVNGHTPGFWSNKNGQKILASNDPSWRKLLNAACLTNAIGTSFDVPFSSEVPLSPSFNNAYPPFRDWLLNGTAVNMAYMLSVQLSCTKLNVAYTQLPGGVEVLLPVQLASCYGSPNAIVTDVIAKADAALCSNQWTPSGSPDRSSQECLKTICDGLNNNLFPFLNLNGPCDVIYK